MNERGFFALMEISGAYSRRLRVTLPQRATLDAFFACSFSNIVDGWSFPVFLASNVPSQLLPCN
jgi:hypothetical protein